MHMKWNKNVLRIHSRCVFQGNFQEVLKLQKSLCHNFTKLGAISCQMHGHKFFLQVCFDQQHAQYRVTQFEVIWL